MDWVGLSVKGFVEMDGWIDEMNYEGARESKTEPQPLLPFFGSSSEIKWIKKDEIIKFHIRKCEKTVKSLVREEIMYRRRRQAAQPTPSVLMLLVPYFSHLLLY